VNVSVDVPAGEHPALIAFSRPFFPGYRARINRHNLSVSSERNLIPLVEVPPGTHGRLTLYYRPDWLVSGGAIAIASAVIWVTCSIFALKFCRGKGD
jgi:hypothetical protein